MLAKIVIDHYLVVIFRSIVSLDKFGDFVGLGLSSNFDVPEVISWAGLVHAAAIGVVASSLSYFLRCLSLTWSLSAEESNLRD